MLAMTRSHLSVQRCTEAASEWTADDDVVIVEDKILCTGEYGTVFTVIAEVE